MCLFSRANQINLKEGADANYLTDVAESVATFHVFSAKMMTAIRGYIIRQDSEHRFCIAKTGTVRGSRPYDPEEGGDTPCGKETNKSISE